jgi:hypothetical protein
VTDNLIVQFVGFQSKPQAREYTFTVREREEEPREYILTIANEAFDSRRVRYQDAPDVCSHKLRRELAGAENHPVESHFFLSNQELDEYRVAHTSKSLKYPYTPKPDPEE